MCLQAGADITGAAMLSYTGRYSIASGTNPTDPTRLWICLAATANRAIAGVGAGIIVGEFGHFSSRVIAHDGTTSNIDI